MRQGLRYYFIVIFPYNGLVKGTPRWDNMERMLDCIEGFQERAAEPRTRPRIVVTDDTISTGGFDDFRKSRNMSRVEYPGSVWSVDTCQNWLEGWRLAYKETSPGDRIILLPGDIDVVSSDFWDTYLPGFFGDSAFRFVLGDYTTVDTRTTKYFVDSYGTYPLLSVWFPTVAQELFRRHVNKPRSEFLNIERDLLGELLIGKRLKFA